MTQTHTYHPPPPDYNMTDTKQHLDLEETSITQYLHAVCKRHAYMANSII